MSVLYKDYCYSDVQEVVDIMNSDPIFVFDQGLMRFGKLDATTIAYDDYGGSYFNYNNSFSLTLCTDLGPQTSAIGISFDDGQELAWLIVAVLVAAFSVKILRRTF